MSTLARGKTTPASTPGSFRSHAHGVPQVDLASDETTQAAARVAAFLAEFEAFQRTNQRPAPDRILLMNGEHPGTFGAELTVSDLHTILAATRVADDAPAPSAATVLHNGDVDYKERDAAYRRLAELAYPADDPEGTIDPRRLRSVFSPSAIVGQAHRIYDYMREHNIGVDSATREAAFAYAAIDTGRSYDDLYEAWLNEQPITSPCKSCGTVIEVRLADATGRCSSCVGEWVREATRRRP